MVWPDWLRLFVLISILGGCAAGPQRVDLAPFPQTPVAAAGGGRTVALTVVDARTERSLGEAPGYSTGVPLYAGNPPEQAIDEALRRKLTDVGFVVAAPGSTAPLSMEVTLLALRYSSEGEPLVNTVRANAAVSVRLSGASQTVSGEYEANSARRVVTPPTATANAYLLNEALGRVLERLLADPKVTNLLSTG